MKSNNLVLNLIWIKLWKKTMKLIEILMSFKKSGIKKKLKKFKISS